MAPRQLILLLPLLIVFLLGCTVQSRHKTRSAMTEEELEEIDRLYSGPSEEEEAEEPEIEPFLEGVEGPAIRVNDLEIDAAGIRDLYEYFTTHRIEGPMTLKREVCMEWIRTYAVMSQWPDTIDRARLRLEELREQVISGADFGFLIVENSQEPGADEGGGDLGTFGRGRMVPIFEMHALTGSLDQPTPVFPTIFGWHLVELLEKNTEDADNPTVHARHLLLFHGLDPENGDTIRENVVRWTNLATVELLVPELNDVSFPATLNLIPFEEL